MIVRIAELDPTNDDIVLAVWEKDCVYEEQLVTMIAESIADNLLTGTEYKYELTCRHDWSMP